MSDETARGKPRTFLTPAYLVEAERGTYVLYRDIEVEQWDDKARKPVRERTHKIPIAVFRKCEAGEQPDLRTIDPRGQGEIMLKSLGRGVLP